MWNTLWGFGGGIVNVVGRLDRGQWLLVFVGVVVFGYFCMKGFGSRAHY